jgi:hypothetical protein
LVYDELKVVMNVKSLNPELGGNAQAIDKCLVFHHTIGHVEVQLNHKEELVSLGGDQNYAFPGPIESERAIEIHAPLLLGDWGAVVPWSLQPKNLLEPGT